MVRRHNLPEAPRDSRGASSWARRVNDTTVDWLAACSRVSAVLTAALELVALALLIWLPSWAMLGTVVLGAAWTAAAGWLGFVYLANPEWRDDDGEAAE